MSEDYHIKYRPSCLEEVIGQDAVIKSLQSLKKKEGAWPHAFLFTGPSGCGKTTLARIIASELKCDSSGILEADAASKSGVDDMRNLLDGLKYQGFGANPNKFIILDEVHSLSKNAWQALLKSLEEPPSHVYFALCTTEIGKVPDTIQTRCHSYNLKSVRYQDIQELLEIVVESEGLKLETNAITRIAKECQGSVRKALVYLSMSRDCVSANEVSQILESAEGEEDVISLCRLLVGRQQPSWEQIMELLKKLSDTNPESIRIVMVNYLASCIMRSKREGEVAKFLNIMSHFSEPYNPSEKIAPLLLSLGGVIFSE